MITSSFFFVIYIHLEEWMDILVAFHWIYLICNHKGVQAVPNPGFYTYINNNNNIFNNHSFFRSIKRCTFPLLMIENNR